MAILEVASTGYNVVDSVVGIFESHPKDDGRRRTNAEAYSLALSGNRGAAEFLKGRSGKFGLVKITVAAPGIANLGAMIGGWATESTRADAYNKYLAVKDRYAGLGGGQEATQKISGDVGIGQVREGSSGNVSPALAGIIPESVVRFAPYILIGITALWALKYAKKLR